MLGRRKTGNRSGEMGGPKQPRLGDSSDHDDFSTPDLSTDPSPMVPMAAAPLLDTPLPPPAPSSPSMASPSIAPTTPSPAPPPASSPAQRAPVASASRTDPPAVRRTTPPTTAGRRISGSDARSQAAAAERRKLIVGREISLAGQITACEHLVVEGSVNATLANGQTIEIADGGLFTGAAVVDTAGIAGRFHGKLYVRQRLTIHASGRIEGSVRCGELVIVAGGKIEGDVAEITEETLPAVIAALDGQSGQPAPQQQAPAQQSPLPPAPAPLQPPSVMGEAPADAGYNAGFNTGFNLGPNPGAVSAPLDNTDAPLPGTLPSNDGGSQST